MSCLIYFISAGFSPMLLARTLPFPFTTAMQRPKNALRRGAVKRSIDVWQPLSVATISAPSPAVNSIVFSAHGHSAPSASTTSAVMNVRSRPR